MARATRIVLDFALVSLKTIPPAVSKLWGTAKAAVVKTKAKPLVCNIVVSKFESALDTTSKAARPAIGIAWQYAKTEMVPPMTLGFFHGAPGKSLEKTVASSVDGFISGLQRKIKNIDEEEIKAQKAKEAAIKAAQEKVKAAAKAKAEEQRKVEEQKQKEVEKAAKAKADAKAQEDAKKAADKPKEAPKAEKKKQAKKDPPKPTKKPAKK